MTSTVKCVSAPGLLIRSEHQVLYFLSFFFFFSVIVYYGFDITKYHLPNGKLNFVIPNASGIYSLPFFYCYCAIYILHVEYKHTYTYSVSLYPVLL